MNFKIDINQFISHSPQLHDNLVLPNQIHMQTKSQHGLDFSPTGFDKGKETSNESSLWPRFNLISGILFKVCKVFF